ncbi:hypothetical protein Tco_1519793 [Tanacetum coccineum]
MLESTRFTFVYTDLFVLGWSSTLFLFSVLAGRIIFFFVLLLGFDPLASVEVFTPVEGITGILVCLTLWCTSCFCVLLDEVLGSSLKVICFFLVTEIVPAGSSSNVPADYVSAGHVLVPADRDRIC